MAGFTKLFSDIVRSTIWREANHVRIVWVTMLAIAEKDGLVESSLPGLADMARVSLEECEEALELLSKPDQYSRSTEFEGRRIKPVEAGWLILNYLKYRNRLSATDRREYQRVKQVEYRKKKKLGGPQYAERLAERKELEEAKKSEDPVVRRIAQKLDSLPEPPLDDLPDPDGELPVPEI